MNWKLSEIIYSRVYLPVRVRVSCTTKPWISWNCKNFCISCCFSTSCERLTAVISQAQNTLMRIGTRLWWRKIGSVKSEDKRGTLLSNKVFFSPVTCFCVFGECKTEEYKFRIIWDKCIARTIVHCKAHVANHIHFAIFNFIELFFHFYWWSKSFL